MCNILFNTLYTSVFPSQINYTVSIYPNMKKQLKCLDETIAELEREVEINPHPFLLSTLERLKLYRDNEIDKIMERIETVSMVNKDNLRSGFKGYGIS